MKPAVIVALVVGIVNIVPGILLIILKNPLGSLSKTIHSKLPIHPPGTNWLHQGSRIQKFFLILGCWLILWGLLLSLLFYVIVDKQEKENNKSSHLTENRFADFSRCS